jgi:hypothetical protein
MNWTPPLAIFLVIAAAPSFGAPSKPASDVRAMDDVRKALNDPYSARFRGIKRTGPKSFCGWVNAKNAYGGYAGDQLFYDEDGFVQIFDLAAAFDAADIAEQTHLFATRDFDRALAIKPRLSEEGKKVELCLHDRGER